MEKVHASLRSSILLALGALVVSPGAYAQAEDQVQQCASAYEQAQVARNDGRLREAQEQLRVCVADGCPEFVRLDCGQWLSDVKREIPSIIFSVVDTKDAELGQYSVTLDGQPLEVISGKAVEVDPGQHEFVVDYKGRQTTEKLIIRQGEKNRVVVVKIATELDSDDDGVTDDVDDCPGEPGPADNVGCPRVAVAPVQEPLSPAPGGVPILSYVGWGAGVAGLATFAVFGSLGKAVEDKAVRDCPPETFCEDHQERIDSVNQKYLIANISAGVGAAGAIVGTVLFFLHNSGDGQQPTTGVQAAPLTHGGGFVSYSGSF